MSTDRTSHPHDAQASVDEEPLADVHATTLFSHPDAEQPAAPDAQAAQLDAIRRPTFAHGV